MSENAVTLNEVVTAVRELTFDRFIIPAFAIKQVSDGSVSVNPPGNEDAGSIIITIDGTAHTYSFTDYPTMESLMAQFINDGIVVAYTPYFHGKEPTSALIKVTDKNLSTDNFTAFRKYFFSDEEIKAMIEWYYYRVLDITGVAITDELLGMLIRPSEMHMAIWVSYHLVDKRRLYENAAGAIGQSFTDGSDYEGFNDEGSGLHTTVQIGSVFTITEDPDSEGFFYEDFNRVGSDNVWGDRYSFWYKLMLYLRGLLEDTFGDYSLRKDNVIPGYISLIRELDFRAYYDSYPFVLSPLSRGILSKV